jgi:protein tyrosine/serine phosphatase
MNRTAKRVVAIIHHNKSLRRAFVLLAALILAFACWEVGVKDQFYPKNFGVVEEGQIYRSGRIASRLIKNLLLKYKIKVVISLSGDSNSNPNMAESQAVAELGIKRSIYFLRGNGTGDVNDYAEVVAEICRDQKEKKPVLIRCIAGAQRTGGIIVAYRLIVQQKDVNSVRAEMISYGFDPTENKNLRVFLNNNMMKIAGELKKMGVIDKIPPSIPEIKK